MFKKEEFISKDILSVNKTIKALQYLNQGRDLEMGGFTYMLGETDTDGFMIMMRCGDGTYMRYVGDIDDFSTECNKLTEDELVIMSANIVLGKLNTRS